MVVTKGVAVNSSCVPIPNLQSVDPRLDRSLPDIQPCMIFFFSPRLVFYIRSGQRVGIVLIRLILLSPSASSGSRYSAF
jgi:hypothetical protein